MHRVVAEFDLSSTTSTASGYVDNSIDAGLTSNAGGTPGAMTTLPWFLGATNTVGFPLNGKIARVLVWNRLLSVGEISALDWGLLSFYNFWTPAKLNPRWWVTAKDASTIVLNGNTVSTWANKGSDSSSLSNASAAQQPTRLPADPDFGTSVNGDGGDWLSNKTTFPSLTQATIAFLFKQNVRGTNYQVISYIGELNALGTLFVGFMAGSNVLSVRWLNGAGTTQVSTTTTFEDGSPKRSVIISLDLSATGAAQVPAIYINGVADTLVLGSLTGSPGSTNPNVFSAFSAAFQGANAYNINGKLPELIVVDRIISAAERDELSKYWKAEFGIAYPMPTNVIPTMWFDASDPNTITATGSLVSAWTNKGSAGGAVTQAVSLNQPTYSANDLGFPGVRTTTAATDFKYLSMTAPTLTAAMEFFFVFQRDADPPTPGISTTGSWTMGSSPNVTYVPFSDGIVYDDTGSTTRKTTVDPTRSFTLPSIYSVVSTATEWTNYLNGLQLFTVASNVTGLPASIGLGVSGLPPQAGFGGVFREVIAFGVKLNASDRTLLINYLKTKWGVP
jgi:hypothetical protein